MTKEQLIDFPPAYYLYQDKSFRAMQLYFWKRSLLGYLSQNLEYRVDLRELQKWALFKYEPTAELLQTLVNELVDEYLAFKASAFNYLVFSYDPFQVVVSVLSSEPSTMYELRCKLESTIYKGLIDDKYFFDQMLVKGEQQRKWTLLKDKGELKGIQLV